MKRRLYAVFAAVSLLGCERGPEPPSKDPTGEFGIFFGGQIQERRDIAFELDRSKQLQGFRIELPSPLPRDIAIEWSIDKPKAQRAPAKKSPNPEVDAPTAQRVAALARATLRAGETRFDRALPFEPGDPLGVWNVRVVADGKVVIDRPFDVYDPSARATAARDGGR